MALNEQLVDKIREALQHTPHVEEKYMFGGVCFMVNDKMCVGVVKNEMMCRLNPHLEEVVLEKNGCRPMDFTGKKMKSFVFVSEEVLRKKSELDYWIKLCLEYNAIAKASSKKKKKSL